MLYLRNLFYSVLFITIFCRAMQLPEIVKQQESKKTDEFVYQQLDLQKEKVKNTKAGIDIVDSHGQKQNFSFEDFAPLSKCTIIGDVLQETTSNHIDFRTVENMRFPVTLPLLKTLIAAIKDPALVVESEHLHEGQLFSLAHQWGAPLRTQWNLAQQCYKQLHKILEANKNKLLYTTSLGIELRSTLSLGNFLLLESSSCESKWGDGGHLIIPYNSIILTTDMSSMSQEQLKILEKISCLKIKYTRLLEFSVQKLKKYFPLLSSLDISHNNITHLHKSQFEGITPNFWLDISNNPIASLDAHCFDVTRPIVTDKYIPSAYIDLRETYLTGQQLAKAHLSNLSEGEYGLIMLSGSLTAGIMAAIITNHVLLKLLSRHQWDDPRLTMGVILMTPLLAVLLTTSFFVVCVNIYHSSGSITINHESGTWRAFNDSNFRRWRRQMTSKAHAIKKFFHEYSLK